jgi:hypothetical protein
LASTGVLLKASFGNTRFSPGSSPYITVRASNSGTMLHRNHAAGTAFSKALHIFSTALQTAFGLFPQAMENRFHKR